MDGLLLHFHPNAEWDIIDSNVIRGDLLHVDTEKTPWVRLINKVTFFLKLLDFDSRLT